MAGRVLEQQRRAALAQNAIADFSHLEIGIDRHANPLEQPVALEMCEKFPEILVLHDSDSAHGMPSHYNDARPVCK
jgi:hypothetical protein